MKQLDALMRRHQQATREKEFLFGQLTAAVANFSFCHPEKAVAPQDYMPSEMMRKKAPAKPKRINRKKAAESVRNFFAPMMKKSGAPHVPRS